MEDDQDLTGAQNNLAAGDKGGDQKTVPLSALADERSKRQALEEKVKVLEENIALYRANMPDPNARREPEKVKETDLFEGLDEGDVLTVGEVKKIFQKKDESFRKEKEDFVRGMVASLSEVQMMIANPDYKDVITKNLPNVLKAKPYLREAIRTSQNPALLAYELGKLDPEYKEKKTGDEIDEKAKKIIDNLNKPNLGGVKGGGALELVSQYTNLTDDQLEERIAQIKNK